MLYYEVWYNIPRSLPYDSLSWRAEVGWEEFEFYVDDWLNTVIKEQTLIHLCSPFKCVMTSRQISNQSLTRKLQSQ